MRRVEWNPDAAAILADAAGSAADLECVAAEVRAGDSQLWELSGDTTGYAVLRLEETPLQEHELVLVLGAGTGTRALIDQVKRWAVQIGADSVRVHVKNPALERIFTHRDFQRSGVVLNWRPD